MKSPDAKKIEMKNNHIKLRPIPAKLANLNLGISLAKYPETENENEN